MRRMYADRNFYPDANSTMRLSFGTICGYSPFDGAVYDYFTTAKGIFEKVKEHDGDIDFAVQPELLNILSSGDFGRYANEEGDMSVCFISNNDITEELRECHVQCKGRTSWTGFRTAIGKQ